VRGCVPDIYVLAETATFSRCHHQDLSLHASGSEQFLFVARWQPEVESRGQASAPHAQNVVLRSKDDVTEPTRVASALHRPSRIGVCPVRTYER
jgi:hypothetical protein